MPNWCNNYVTVTHSDPSMIQKFLSAAENESVAQTFLPEPENIGDDWYDWRYSHWGTNQDFGLESFSVVGDTVSGYCDTAWAPPVGVFAVLEKQGFVVRAIWHEGGQCFAGEYENGETTEYNNIEYTEEGLGNLPENIVEAFSLYDFLETQSEESA